MFSKSCEYAIQSCIIIAQFSKDNNKINLTDLSEFTGAPQAYLGKIMQKLVKEEVVCSVKGPGGGFFFKENVADIKLMNIVRAIDGDALTTRCVLGLQNCSSKNPCALHDKFESIRNEIRSALNSNDLQVISELVPIGQLKAISQ